MRTATARGRSETVGDLNSSDYSSSSLTPQDSQRLQKLKKIANTFTKVITTLTRRLKATKTIGYIVVCCISS